MPIFAGNTAPAGIRIGATPVQAVYVGSALIWSGATLSVSVFPLTVYNTFTSVTASATGGSGAYTYQWQRVSGSNNISATSPSSNTTAFSVVTNQPASAVWRCKVSAGGQSAFSPTVDILLNGGALE